MRTSALANLRIAAALSHRLAFSVRLSHADRPVFHVGLTCPADGDDVPCVTPCGFRVAVADAWRLQRQGRIVSLRGMPTGVDAVIDLEPPAGGAAWPGGIYEVPLRDGTLYAFPTTARLDACRRAARPADFDLHVDPLLGVTVVQSVAGRDGSAARHALLAAAGELVVAEVIEDVAIGILP